MLCAGLFATNALAQLQVAANNNASQLATNLAGAGVTVSNFTINCPTGACGTFTNGGSTNLGLTSGVALTTGTVAGIPQAGTAFASTSNNAGGDANLNAIAPVTTFDACILQFNIVPQGNTLSFRYVFGSEEYPEFVCSQFNDVFGFFVTGPNPGGGNYNSNNIATIPNSGLSVAINTVNSGTPGSGYAASGCQSLAFSNLYVNNTNGTTIVYDGFTTVLTASLAVIPCSTYTIKLAIADGGDRIYDSGVFLESNSFNSTPTTVTTGTTVSGFTEAYEGCVGGVFTINYPDLVTSSTPIQYTIGGTATNGVDYSPLSGTAFVLPGTSTALVYVDGLQDNVTEGPETVILTVINPCTGQPLASSTIVINDNLPDTAFASDYLVCSGDQAQLTASGGNAYSWTPTTGLSNPNIANPVATIDSTITYTAAITFGTCVGIKSVTINANKLNVNPGTIPGVPVCPGDSIVIGAGTSGGNEPISYEWSPTAGLQFPDSQFTVAFPTATTTYTVTATDQTGCTATGTVTAQVHPLTPPNLGNSFSVCIDSVATLNAGGPYASYIWSNADTTAQIVVAPGTYSVTVTDLNGCTVSSNPVTISYFPQSTAFLADTGLCPGDTITLSATSGFTNVIWTNGASGSSVDITNNITIGYTATDPNGCPVTSNNANITLSQVPAVNATASPDTICAGATTTLNSGAVVGLQYLWLPGQETTSSISVSSPGTYIVRVRDQFCAAFDTVTVYQYTPPIFSIRNDTTVCPGVSVTVFVNGGPFTSYQWSNGATTPTTSVNAVGNYSVLINDGNCTYPSDTFTLTNLQVATPLAFADTTVCAGEPVELIAEADFSNYGWSNNQAGANITVTSAGQYSFTATDVNGCTVTSTTVTVTHTPYPTPNIVANPAAICIGQGQTTLTAGNETGVTYTWQPGGQTTSSIQTATPGTYIVTADRNGCITLDTLVVVASDSPAISLPPLVKSCCERVILDPAPGQAYSYQWSDSTTVSGPLTINFTDNAPATYTVIATNNFGCTATASVVVQIKCIDAAATATPDTINFGEISALDVTTAYNTNFTYSWSPAAGLNDANIQSPQASPVEPTTYTVIVADNQDECFDTAQVTVVIIYPDQFAIPNAFTPNGDGKNDVFYPILLGNQQQVIEFRIYNRWGQLVHNNTDAWTGSFESKDQPTGSYTYYIVVRTPNPQAPGTTKDHKLQGSFTLVR